MLDGGVFPTIRQGEERQLAGSSFHGQAMLQLETDQSTFCFLIQGQGNQTNRPSRIHKVCALTSV